MTTATNAIPQPNNQTRPTRGRLRLALFLLVVILAGGLGGYAWYRFGAPQPPTVDLTGVDAEVAEAIEAARREVLRSPRTADTWGKLGKLLWIHEYRTTANVCFARAEQLDPLDPRWPYYQGLTALLSEPAVAIPHLQRAAELCGDWPTAVRLRLAEALQEQGRTSEAEQQFRRILQAEPDNPAAHLGLGRLAYDRDALADCQAHLGRAQQWPSTRKAAHTLLAAVYRRLQDSSAEEREARLVRTLPDDAPGPDPFLEEMDLLARGKSARLRRAEKFLSQDRLPEALAALEDLVRDYPDLDWGWLRLGRALLQMHDLAGAERALQRAVELGPGLVDAHFYLGVVASQRGDFQAAAGHFGKAVELKPDYGVASFNLGECLLRQGDKAGAVKAFQQALASKPQLADAHFRLAELLGQQGQKSEALQHLNAARQLEPADPRGPRLLAELSGDKKP